MNNYSREATGAVWLLAMLLTTLSGCAAGMCRFRAAGNVVSATGDQLPDSPPLFTVIADALRPFGFNTGEIPREGLSFFTLGGGLSLGARIDVTVDPGSKRITFFDYNENVESDLDRKILESIKRQIASAYGAKVVFNSPPKRIADCIGP